MRGLHIELDVGYDDFINKLFHNIKWVNDEWYITESEIIDGKIKDNLNLPYKSKGVQLLHMLCNKEYLLVFLNLQIYPQDANRAEIKTYDDFVNSNCKLVLLISDVKYIDIYVKDARTLLQLKENAESLSPDNLVILTSENDYRYNMKAF